MIELTCHGCRRPFERDEIWFENVDGYPYCSPCLADAPPVGQYVSHPALPDTLWLVKEVLTNGVVRLDYYKGPLGTKADRGLIFHDSTNMFRLDEARLSELTIVPPLVVIAMAANED